MRVVALVVLLISNLAMAEEETLYDVVIVGGGVAGMTAAYELKDQNILVLERWPEVGGRVWDDTYQGFNYARGAEYLGEPDGVLKKIVKKYKLKPVQIQSPTIRHFNPDVPGYKDVKLWNGYYGIAMMHIKEDGGDEKALETYNRFQRYTTKFVEQTYDAGELPHMFNLKHMVAKFDHVTMLEWFLRQGFGHTYYNKWNSHSRGLYGAPYSEVSALMAISELGWEYYGEEDIEMPKDDWNDWVPNQYDTETYTFMEGLSAIPKGIATDKKLKDKVTTNAKVVSVTKRGKQYKLLYKDRTNKDAERTVAAKKVVLAVPATVVLKIAGDALSKEVVRIMSKIKYCEYLTVNMFSDQPILDHGAQDATVPKSFEISTPDTFWVVSFYDALYVQKTERPDNPDNDKVFIATAYIAGRTCDDELAILSDKEIMLRTYQDLNKIFPGASRVVKDFEVNRFKHAYPLMGTGAYHRITRLNKINMRQKSIRLVGDYMALPTLEAAMEQASFATQKFKVD